ncbi:Methyltransferase type 11 [Paenibacillus vortex V453]|jgi:ubiquinone/menaquinone biosynthesis C-methylase UbiE|uniref:Methyltransferase type 11 n=2 Tax=Paenibacillus TaxID=44249 RepID=A0A2R9SSG1_9BACL|nr:class I SAM-dependent methyltransferase [Paenibacillus vortex]EFU40251.1 Methyltransferase type 11 [Paenibacillus vortex V453]
MNYIQMLSRLGMGSAHPGGFEATLRMLKNYPIEPNSRILEVGCGTGRTACHLSEMGYQVTAIDLNENMIKKARTRAEAMKMDVQFLQADVCELPFEDNQFDLIMAESVTVFTNTSRSLPEYYRVLDQGGVLLDRELLLNKPMPEPKLKELLEFFGIPNLMLREEWAQSLLACGFKQEEILEYNHFNEQLKEEQTRHLDTFEQRDKGLLFDVTLWETLFKHDRMILDNTDYLASALFRAVK